MQSGFMQRYCDNVTLSHSRLAICLGADMRYRDNVTRFRFAGCMGAEMRYATLGSILLVSRVHTVSWTVSELICSGLYDPEYRCGDSDP